MDSPFFEKFYNSSLRFLSYRPRSEKEIRDNLVKKKAPQEIIESIISKLKEQRFLNDEEFAQFFVKSRISNRPKAVRVIKMELKRKGISEELIEKTIGDKELEVNDMDTARRLVEKKIDKYKALPRQEIYQKLGSFLARRGFDWDTVKRAIDEKL